jgi:hypothetical protein
VDLSVVDFRPIFMLICMFINKRRLDFIVLIRYRVLYSTGTRRQFEKLQAIFSFTISDFRCQWLFISRRALGANSHSEHNRQNHYINAKICCYCKFTLI